MRFLGQDEFGGIGVIRAIWLVDAKVWFLDGNPSETKKTKDADEGAEGGPKGDGNGPNAAFILT